MNEIRGSRLYSGERARRYSFDARASASTRAGAVSPQGGHKATGNQSDARAILEAEAANAA